jgi:hypothetical protein
VSSYNAFVIWNKINPTWMPDKQNKRRVFLEQLGKALVTPHIQRRERLPHTTASAELVKAVQGPDPVLIHLMLQLGKRRRCQFCPPKKDCKTNTMCCTCEIHLQSPCTHTYILSYMC